MDRGYQYGFSDRGTAMFNVEGRQRKAETMVKVLTDCLGGSLDSLSVLNVGGSAGIIDEYLSRYFRFVTGIDIDEKAIEYAQSQFKKENLKFELGDAMDMPYADNSFDVVICSQVYEHVPNAFVLMDEIYRVLRCGGVVYFAAGNRIMLNEPHYNLPFLSLLPRSLSHRYLKLSGKGEYYYEKHFTYWGLKKLVRNFQLIDYTRPILENPNKFGAEYMVSPGSLKQRVSVFLVKYFTWLVPGYIWVLVKR